MTTLTPEIIDACKAASIRLWEAREPTSSSAESIFIDCLDKALIPDNAMWIYYHPFLTAIIAIFFFIALFWSISGGDRR